MKNFLLFISYQQIRNFLITIAFCGFINTSEAQTVWTNYYNINLHNSVSAVDTANDNGYFIVGRSIGQGTGGDYFAYKLDSSGAEIWHVFGNKYNGFNFENYATCVVNTGDGGCLIGGIVLNWGVYNLYFVRIDSSGQVLWEKMFGGVNGQILTSAIKNGNNYLCAYIESTTNLPAYILSLNDNGDSLWSKDLSIHLSQAPSALIKGQNGNFFLYGGVFDTTTSIGDLAFLEIDSIGDSVSCKIFPDTSSGSSISINEIVDGGFLFCSYDYVHQIAYLSKTMHTGTVIWKKVFYNVNMAVSTVMDANNYLLSLGGLNNQISLVLLDSLGNIQGNHSIQTLMLQSELYDNITDRNGGVLISGSNYDSQGGQTDPSLGMISRITLDVFNSINELSNHHEIQIYPNPINVSKGHLMIQAKKKLQEITIVNCYGEIIYRTNLNDFAYQPQLNINLNVNNIVSAGIYYLIFKIEGLSPEIKKLIVVE